ncbi:hypothetical protein FE90_0101 [Streptococcus pyogenes]|nr:hypothetical protein FE90_0101 [Streptococcus pyogenes]
MLNCKIVNWLSILAHAYSLVKENHMKHYQIIIIGAGAAGIGFGAALTKIQH